jgi:hypothetical protein
MTTISPQQWQRLGVVQRARFDERLLAYVDALLGDEAAVPCTFTSAEIVQAAHRMAARIGARTERQITQVAVILAAIDLLAVPARHAQAVGRILGDEDEPVDQRLSDAARSLGVGA